MLERIVPEIEGFIAFDDLRAAIQTLAPGLEEAFSIWGLGITVSDAGIPLRDGRAFLRALRAIQRVESRRPELACTMPRGHACDDANIR